ncbi:solute carrier family 40 member 1-like [Tetranychus urticae]|uniref:solute carrier family 40 member 1-like n=1 Tax=Tetranychus urticae TaxID=32264 RepID=UPI00077BEC85|nr:solute carrier family 40 member 1-like [Tetranychus urticae]XP_025015952.1 solute carrier family 40 member 1-like [Tetranychus urticae]
MHSANIDYLLYLDRALNSWGDRCWEFAIGLYLIKLNPDSLLLSALHGILASSLTIIIVPYLGRWISKAPRLKEVAVFLFVQNFCVFISATFVAFYFIGDDILGPSLNRIADRFAPCILVIFSALAQVFSYGYTLSLEKDWIIVISKNGGNLSELNATLRRIDLIMKTIAPLIVGFIMEWSSLASALFLMFFNVVSGLLEYLIMVKIYKLVPELAKDKRLTTVGSDLAIENSTKNKVTFIESIVSYLKYFGLPGISFGLIYLSVLGFDSITVGFIKSQGVTESVIGIISVLGAVTGIIGTIFFQSMVKHSNLNAISTIGYFMDLIPLTLCLIIVFAPSHLLGVKLFKYDLSIVLFLAGITLSRIGLWSADLATNQLIQTTTPNPPLIGGIQNSVNTSAELIKFIITAILSSVSQFYILILVSYGSILIATLISIFYTINCLKKLKTKSIIVDKDMPNISRTVADTVV